MLGIKLIVLGEVMHGVVDIAIAAIARVVAVHHAHIFSLGSENTIVGKRLRRIEVIHEYKIAAHIGEHLVVVLIPQLTHRLCLKFLHALYEMNHIVVEVVEILVFQVLAVNELPLAACILI